MKSYTWEFAWSLDSIPAIILMFAVVGVVGTLLGLALESRRERRRQQTKR